MAPASITTTSTRDSAFASATSATAASASWYRAARCTSSWKILWTPNRRLTPVRFQAILIRQEQMQLGGAGVARNLDWIVTGEARVAKSLATFAVERVQTVPTEVGERVGRDVFANLLDRMRRREQLLAR